MNPLENPPSVDSTTAEGPVSAAAGSNSANDPTVALRAEYGQLLAQFGALCFDLEKTLAHKAQLAQRIEALTAALQPKVGP